MTLMGVKYVKASAQGSASKELPPGKVPDDMLDDGNDARPLEIGTGRPEPSDIALAIVKRRRGEVAVKDALEGAQGERAVIDGLAHVTDGMPMTHESVASVSMMIGTVRAVAGRGPHLHTRRSDAFAKGRGALRAKVTNVPPRALPARGLTASMMESTTMAIVAEAPPLLQSTPLFVETSTVTSGGRSGNGGARHLICVTETHDAFTTTIVGGDEGAGATDAACEKRHCVDAACRSVKPVPEIVTHTPSDTCASMVEGHVEVMMGCSSAK